MCRLQISACKQTWALSVSSLSQKTLQEGSCSSCFQLRGCSYLPGSKVTWICFLLPTEVFPFHLLPLMIQSQRIIMQTKFFRRVRQKKKGLLCATLAVQKRKKLSCLLGFSLWSIPSNVCSEMLFIGKGWKMHLILKEDVLMLQKEMLFFSAISSDTLFFQHLSYWFKNSSLAGTLDNFCLVCNLNLLWLEQKPELGLNKFFLVECQNPAQAGLIDLIDWLIDLQCSMQIKKPYAMADF